MKRTMMRCLAVVVAMWGLVGKGQEAFMVVEAHSGKVLMAANSSVKRPVASLTKMATAAIASDWAEASGLDPAKVMMVVPEVVGLLGGPNPMGLRPGERMSLRDGLYSAMLGSDNLAALTVAHHVGGELLRARGQSGDPVVAFVGEMNELARGLKMKSTKFANPHGLELPKRTGVSTAADMARLSIYVMRKPAITFMTRQKDRQVTVEGLSGRRSFKVANTNELVGEPGVIGIKTGTTQAAGACLAVAVDREPRVWTRADGQKVATPRRMVVVILNQPDRFQRARTLLGQGWGLYERWSQAGAPVENRRKEILEVPQLRP